jgi:prepilin-type processing-associated H-X9-DG protein
MSIQFTCPQCGVTTEVDDRFAGQTGPCRQCGATVTVPGGSAAPFGPPPKKSSAPIVIAVLAVCLVGALACGGVLVALLLPAVQAPREAALRNQCSNNLKQISLALANYQEVHGEYPPQYIADAEGKPMHSWRVLILPYLEHQALYDQYDFDEPWDGPRNSLLAAQMPPAFRCASDPAMAAGGTITSYVGVSGPGAFFDGQKSTRAFAITDGLSNTISVVEFAGGGVHWMEPRDLDASLLSGIVNPPDGQNISSYHPGGAQAAFADGSVRFLSSSIDPKVLRALTTIAGNEVVQDF